MQSSTSLSSISSTTSSNSSTYGSRTILDAKDLHLAAPRCRSSIVDFSPSTASLLALPIPTKRFNTAMRKEYFSKLCHKQLLLLVLNDYICQCGCHFTMKKGSFVILYERIDDTSSLKNRKFLTVISNELVCSKVPSEYVCDVNILRERVRRRGLYKDDEQSFDL